MIPRTVVAFVLSLFLAPLVCVVSARDEASTTRPVQPAPRVGPQDPEEVARKEAIDEVRRQLATGRAGHKLPDSFKVEIELDAVGRSVGLREHWVFTPTTVSRLAYIKRGEKWVEEPVATTEFTKIKELCDTLWNGEFLQLAGAGEWICGLGGHGPFFFGTPFIGGERMINPAPPASPRPPRGNRISYQWAL